MFVKPAVAGTIIRDPSTKIPLKETGEEKPDSSFWLRRLRDKSIEKTKPVRQDTGKSKKEA